MSVRLLLVLLPLVIFAAQGAREIDRGDMPDLFIYRAGAMLGWRGESPYSTRISAMVAGQWPANEGLIRNCGFFLPPQAVVLFGPFAALPWVAAKMLYTLLTLAGLVACWYGVTLILQRPPRRGWPPLSGVPPLLAWIVTLHLIATMTFMAGQTTILAAAAIVLGQLAFERGRPTLAGFLWAAAFVKPHIALPLLPLAFLLGSWKRGAMLVAWLGVLNLSGCLLAAGTPLFAFDYLDYLRDAHKQVEYNRVGWNYQITSWNRLWYSLSHREIELTTPLTLAGYLTFGAMFALRCALARQRPSPAWLMAVAVTAAVCCCQVLAYELFLLVLVVPLNLELLDANRKKLAWTLAGLLTAHLMPLEIMMEWAKYYHEESTPHLVITSYRSWLVAVQVAVLLCVPPDASAKNR